MDTMPIDPYSDTICSQDVIQRIEQLQEKLQRQPDSSIAEFEELIALLSLHEQSKDYPDWEDGATLIRDQHFPQYAQELAEDCYHAVRHPEWPFTCIDWEQAARELQHDYFPVEYMGQTFWIRA